MKGKSLMIQGTGSSVGKSIITAGLLRIFKQDGHDVAPFKSQNMALNSFITKEGKEMGRAQVVQAEAAGKEPSVTMNPILLKPTTDRKAQVILNGQVYKNMSAAEYHEFKPQLAEMVKETFMGLSSKNDIVVIEGAGSPAEINLRENDIVNMGMAQIARSPVILVGDIDKGGVFASLAGTMLLLTEEEKARVKGVIINKFRGDLEILKPGLDMLYDIIKVPVLGVVPYTKLNIEDEDSLAERFQKEKGANISEIDIVIIKVPHMSNFTDFNPLENLQGVKVRYVDTSHEIGQPDLIVLPGTKNTIEDMLYLKKSGMEEVIKNLYKKGVVIFGVCGGYQMLGQNIEDPYKTESELLGICGMSLLNSSTVFGQKKITTQVEGVVSSNTELLHDLDNTKIIGYEIHMGTTEYKEGCIPFIELNKAAGSAAKFVGGVMNREGSVFGTYIHGIFDNMEFTIGFVNNIRKRKGLTKLHYDKSMEFNQYKEMQYDKLAEILRSSLDIEKIYEIINLGTCNK
ncbi:cobyric acid synthase [Pseudobacteroides cellulosolvens]|uniref:Cobyric acid synthase n=1 Tax=Pseudobacteroides cellulosolvens ATCC 35603 = DSM 2933 TaxID=398512 RepID=A0A0L6JRH5_9FIRM|nr:cobyric acid synthase [Pseudobacteroides cellulosolvens]KNY27997.1 Cobyric acid synthase [Pseudobacteroides cellulosolvens ATCC 35603 = DSM 2933]